MTKSIKWTNIGIQRDRKFEPLINKLLKTDVAVFAHNKDLMVFAAMVGFANKKFMPLQCLQSDRIQITLDTYETTQQDTFVYLLALVEKRNVDCLKTENLTESVKVFEGFCNAGLNIIQGWFDDNPGDPIGIETIVDKVIEQTIINEQSAKKYSDNSGLDPDF